jgi:hypothetical protein
MYFPIDNWTLRWVLLIIFLLLTFGTWLCLKKQFGR